MAYSLDGRLVIGVASSALFDLKQSDAYFRRHGEEKYRRYQHARLDETLNPGVAFPFIQRLLSFNDLRPLTDPIVEVIVLSKNDPATGLRVMRSVEAHNLRISRSLFTQGRAPYEYINALNMSLFLSANRGDVEEALKRGSPAGHVLPSAATYSDDDDALKIAFDFDGVLADDAAERIYKQGGIEAYRAHEKERTAEALAPGPLRELLRDLNMIQKLEEKRHREEPDYRPRLRISIVTARNAPAHERAVNSLTSWGVSVNDAFFLGGIEKSKVLQVMRPHIFFDDQTTHLTPATQHAASVHIPYGVANEKQPKQLPINGTQTIDRSDFVFPDDQVDVRLNATKANSI